MDASFNGTLVKEVLSVRKTSVEHSMIEQVETSFSTLMRDGEETEGEQILLKRKTSICYCVLKLARHGELFKFLEHTDKFSDLLSRSLFK
jgi:hypothetical protein